MRRRSVVATIALGSTVLGAGALGVAVTAGDAEARLDVYVDKSAQRLSVIKNGALLYVWPVSTGRDRYSTPNGVYTPDRLERNWSSKAYYNSPMPYAIFFHNGYAIHGSYDIEQLGGPASHGCVRLHPENAALLFAMVEREGPGGTAIFVGGDSTRPPFRMVEAPPEPVLRRDDGAARGAYPSEPPLAPRGVPDHYADAYPPPDGPRMPRYDRGYIDGRGAYPPGRDAAPRHEAEHRDAGRHDDGRHDDGRSALRSPRMEPYHGDTYAYPDGRGAPRGPSVPPDYNAGRYADGRYADGRGYTDGGRYANGRGYTDGGGYTDGRSALRGPPLPSDYADPSIDGRGAPYDSRMPPPDYRFDRYADGRSAPYGRSLPPDYDPYLDRRGAPPQGPNPPSYYVPDRHGDRLSDRVGDGRPDEPHGVRTVPYSPAEHHSAAERAGDGADRRHDDSRDRAATRGYAPVSRPLALRPDGNMAGDQAPRHGLQPQTANAKPNPGSNPGSHPGAAPPSNPGAKLNPGVNLNPGAKLNPGARPNPETPPNPGARATIDEPPGRHVTTSQAVRMPAPAAPAAQPPSAAPWPPAARVEPERAPPEIGYRVLPPSYWAGASWRWRTKRDDDAPQDRR